MKPGPALFHSLLSKELIQRLLRKASRRSTTSQSELLLPLEARGKSQVGCAQQANLEQALADTTQLQRQADAVLERMTRQRSALKRIPVTCPSCGTLNVPRSGTSWSGDLVPCQECRQPFLPLSNSFQEADLLVLKTVIKRLRDQAEQIQYLECLLQKKGQSRQVDPSPRTAAPHVPSKLGPAVPQEPWSPIRKASASPAERLDARQFLSPCSLLRHERERGSGDLTPSSPESGQLEADKIGVVFKLSVPHWARRMEMLYVLLMSGIGNIAFWTLMLYAFVCKRKSSVSPTPPRDGVTAEAPTMEQIHGFQKVAPEGSATKETTCSICLEDIEIGESCRELQCGPHIFHAECLYLWWERCAKSVARDGKPIPSLVGVNCPTCRRQFSIDGSV
eukprot:symbB.v1.2.028379.t1/scaffold3004.1/size67801/4